MAWTQSDLDTLESQIDLIRKTTFADGRQVEKQDLDKILALRDAMKREVTAAAGRANPMPRTTVGRIFR